MFIVRRVRRGIFSDQIYLEALKGGVLTKQWLALDRLASWTLKSEQWTVAPCEIFSLRVPKGSSVAGEKVTKSEIEAINLKSLRRRRLP